MRLLAPLGSALMQLIVQWMIFLFLPSMRKFASILRWTPLIISSNEILSNPVWTLLFVIVKDVGFPSKVLPIVSIDTEFSGMLHV